MYRINENISFVKVEEQYYLYCPMKEIVNIALEDLPIINDIIKNINNDLTIVTRKYYLSEEEFSEYWNFCIDFKIILPIIEPKEKLESYYMDKYTRQLSHFNGTNVELSSEDFQQNLLKSKVLVIGVGGVGSYISYSLASTGVGEIHLIDNDRIELSNTSRQILYDETDVGEYKVDVAKRKLQNVNSKLKCKTFNFIVKSMKDLDVVDTDYDLIICCADMPRGHITSIINDFSLKNNIPWIIQGPTSLTQIFVGPLFIPGETRSYDELFPIGKFFGEPLLEELNSHFIAAIADPYNGMAAKISSAEIFNFLSKSYPPQLKEKRIVINTNPWEFELVDYKNT